MKALKALQKLSSGALKIEKLFQKPGSIFPVIALTEVKGKTGYHGTNEVVCYHVNVFDGPGLTNCAPIVVTISNFPASAAVVLGPTAITNTDFCVTTTTNRGGAILTATGCDKASSLVLINSGQ